MPLAFDKNILYTYSLTGASKAPRNIFGNPTVKRIFGVPMRVLSLSRQQMLTNLRWHLRPQSFDFRHGAKSDFEATWNAINITSPHLHTLQRRCCVDMVQSHQPWMDSKDVEKYLDTRGMKHIGRDCIEFSHVVPAKLDIPRAAPPTSRYGSDFLNFDTFFPIETNAVHYATAAASDTKLVLSLPLLIQNLVAISICLVGGPTFAREDVNSVIMASVTTAHNCIFV